MIRTLLRPRARAQRGVASLVIVVVLLAVMAIGVAFTNRNLVFEQRTSANQYRQTVALEAAEAGLEWALAMMNKPETIGTACTNSTAAGSSKFRDRYFTTDPTTFTIAPRATTTGVANTGVHLACSGNADGSVGWSCSCPTAGTAPNPAAAVATSGFQPSFAIRFEATPGAAGMPRIVSIGCTSRITDDTCAGDGTATVSVAAAPISGLPTPPAAPLTARGTVNIGNAALGVANGDPTTNGITINAGMGIDATNVRITTVPGTPPKTTLVGNDSSLRNTTEEQMFSTFFGMTKSAYQQLPGLTKITCPCTETTLSNAYNNGNGATQIWMTGDLVMNANLTLGTVDKPILLVVDGNVEMRGDIVFYGVIYSTGITWDNTGGGGALLQGAAISEGNYQGNGTPDYVYDPRVMAALRGQNSAYARIPGSWRDF